MLNAKMMKWKSDIKEREKVVVFSISNFFQFFHFIHFLCSQTIDFFSLFQFIIFIFYFYHRFYPDLYYQYYIDCVRALLMQSHAIIQPND